MYMTWARQHFPEMQPGLARVYTSVAQEIGADVAPVGLAWQAAFAADSMLVLHTSDKSHPNSSGSYLAACVFYATFFDASPVGLTAKIDGADGKPLVDLSVVQALFLQKIAWDTVVNYRRDLATGVYDNASCLLIRRDRNAWPLDRDEMPFVAQRNVTTHYVSRFTGTTSRLERTRPIHNTI